MQDSLLKNLYLLDTYSAGEKIINGYESKNIYLKLKKTNKNVVYVGSKNLNKLIYKETTNNKIIIFMGAGSISKLAYNFIKINE